jgi:DNA-binding response OmpR family regulator
MPRRPRVLVIDDDPDQLILLTAALQVEHEVFVASDGLDGYSIACVEQPAIVILDILMPVVDGWTVLRKLRTNPRTKDTRIVILSALDLVVSRREVTDLRVDLVLQKPMNPRDVLRALRQFRER